MGYNSNKTKMKEMMIDHIIFDSALYHLHYTQFGLTNITDNWEADSNTPYNCYKIQFSWYIRDNNDYKTKGVL